MCKYESDSRCFRTARIMVYIFVSIFRYHSKVFLFLISLLLMLPKSFISMISGVFCLVVRDRNYTSISKYFFSLRGRPSCIYISPDTVNKSLNVMLFFLSSRLPTGNYENALFHLNITACS